MTGENNAMDFNFEELEFIGGGLEELEGQPEGTAEGDSDDSEDGGSDQSTQSAGNAGEEGEAAEGDNPEGVSSDSTEEGDGGGKDASPQLYQTLATVLKEQGVFSSVEDSLLKDVKDVDSLVEVIKNQIKAEEFKDLTDEQKLVLQDMRAGVTPTTAGKFKTAMDQLNNIDDDLIAENEQVRFDLIYQDFIAKGFAKDQAKKFANRSFAAKEDLADAKEAKMNLIAAVTNRYNTAKEKDIADAKAELDKIEADKSTLKKRILDTKEVMPGHELSETARKEIYSDMSKMISTNPKTGIPENALMKYQRENPLDYSHKLYFLFKVTNGFKDLSYFSGRKTTNSVKELETALRQSTHVSGGGNPSFADDKNSSFLDIGELVLPE